MRLTFPFSLWDMIKAPGLCTVVKFLPDLWHGSSLARQNSHRPFVQKWFKFYIWLNWHENRSVWDKGSEGESASARKRMLQDIKLDIRPRKQVFYRHFSIFMASLCAFIPCFMVSSLGIYVSMFSHMKLHRQASWHVCVLPRAINVKHSLKHNNFTPVIKYLDHCCPHPGG